MSEMFTNQVFSNQRGTNLFSSNKNNKYHFLLLFLLMLFSFFQGQAQITFNSSVPTNVHVCGDAEAFTVEFTNDSGATISGVQVSVALPTGMSYGGSFSESTSFNVTAVSTGGSTLIFSADDVADGETVSFDIDLLAGFAAKAAFAGGTLFNNEITVSYLGGSEDDTTDPYNVLYPALSVVTVSPNSQSVFVGQTYTRTVTIVNGGYGAISTFTVQDTEGSNISLDAVDIGSLNTATGITTFTSADIANFGDGDGLFEQNEQIIFTQTLTAFGCNSEGSQIKAFWGCDGGSDGSNTKYPYTSIQLFAPNLSVTANHNFNTCFDGANNESLVITNNGTGPANAIELTLDVGSDWMNTRIDAGSVTYTMGGASNVPVSADQTYGGLQPTCLGENAIRKIDVTLPAIQPGATMTVNFDTYTCDTPYCGDIDLYDWDYEMDYTDMCNSKTYSKSENGELKDKNMAITGESPSDLSDAQEGTYTFEVTSGRFNLPEGTNPYYEVVFDIPVGMVWSGNNSDLSWTKNGTTWTPSSVTYNSSTRELTAEYPWAMAYTNLTYSVFDLKLTPDCSQLNGSRLVTVGMQMYYIADSSCPSPHHLPYSCYESVDTYIHCPGPCDHGMVFNNFEVERTSFGQPDNDADGYADASGSLNMGLIRANRVMENDTFNTVFYGTVKTSGTFPSFDFGYAQSTIGEFGDMIELIEAEISIYDVSANTTITCNNVQYVESVSGSTRTIDFDYSPSNLTVGCGAIAGYVFENDDVVTLTATYRVTGNVGGQIEQVTFPNDFYLSDTANGTQYQCNYRAGNITFVGYSYHSWSGGQYNVTDCDIVVEQGFFARVGTNYAGGNPFPYEYRNWSNFHQMRVTIPNGYTVTNTDFRFRNNRSLGTHQDVLVTGISPTSQSGQDLIYDLSAQYVPNGGTVPLSDDGYNGYVYLTLEPDCDVNPAANLPIEYFMIFDEVDKLSGTTTNEVSGADDFIKYKPAKMKITTDLQTVDGTGALASWNVTVKNNASASASPNSWLYLDIPSYAMTLESVEESGTPVTTDANGFYQLGTMAAGESRTYKVTVDYDNCSASSFTAKTGYGCDGYPTDINTFACPIVSEEFHLVPQESQLQTKIYTYTNPTDPCDNTVTIEIEMLSSKIASVVDLFAAVDIPVSESVTITPGSVEVKYPFSGNYSTISDPTLVGGVYTITGADMDGIIGTNGLVGVTDVTSNMVNLRFDLTLDNSYKPGDYTTLSVGGDRPCGDALPTLAMVYDPSASFGKPTGIGLGDSDNNWGMAWGDYDNDGNVDLFVTNYETDEPNLLYHNNGDGTFTKITTGAIATDVASSLAASWADYDNDGDLDLYVANNVGFNNFLYRNNGNGTFTSIQNDPIVNDVYYSHSAAWADYDKDGYLDMFVADYFTSRFNRLYKNNGDGTFSEVTTTAVNLEANFSVSGVWGDYNNDGYPDLFVSNTNGANNSLYKNTGNGTFEAVTTGSIVSDGGHSVGASWGDYDNDGDLDLFVSNAANEDNFLYRNNGNETFTKITTGEIVNDGGNSHGSSWADYDNDGDLDMFVTNDQDENNFLYSNNGDGTFTALVNDLTQDGGESFGTGWADYDNDGDLDLYIANHENSKNYIYDNERGYCQGKACVTLEGTNTNGSAVGTRIYAKANIYGQDVWQMREISSQTGGGTGGQNEYKQIFGVGDANQIDSLVIEWTSGLREVRTNVALDNCQTIVEPDAARVCSTVYYDANENCIQDPDEYGVPNMEITILPSGKKTYSDENGEFEINLEIGTYTLEFGSNLGWNTSSCESNTSTVDVQALGNEYCGGNDFALRTTCTFPDLHSNVNTAAQRIGFENVIALNYGNQGATESTNTTLKFLPDVNTTILSGSLPWDDIINDTLIWNLGTLAPFTNQTIYLVNTVSNNVNIDDPLMFESKISNGTTDDCLTGNNEMARMSPATGALDPNDMLVSPQGMIRAKTDLTYTVRFENIGELDAQTVRIESTLPDELDIESLVMGTTSHPYNLTMDGRKMIWTFENIDLPPSIEGDDETGHGYVKFRVRPNSGIKAGTVIRNFASIFFDNNLPINTNIVHNFIETSKDREVGKLFVYPNPIEDRCTIQIQDELTGNNGEIQILKIYNIMGQVVYQEYNVQSLSVDLHTQLESGQYMIQASDITGRLYNAKIIVR